MKSEGYKGLKEKILTHFFKRMSKCKHQFEYVKTIETEKKYHSLIFCKKCGFAHGYMDPKEKEDE